MRRSYAEGAPLVSRFSVGGGRRLGDTGVGTGVSSLARQIAGSTVTLTGQ